ncbi:ThiF family adenylyltransferase [Chloroflexota bacterium]
MECGYKEIFSRNIGMLTESDQDKLRKCTLAIAGVGGVGGLLAERLIRLGFGQLKITDPGLFEPSNLNRQAFSSTLNLGRNKAEVVFSQIKDINPEAKISWSPKGIKTENDANLFVSDCDVVIDEMDMGLFKESILLQRAARRKGIYYMFTCAYGFGALIAIFDPRGITLEEYDGLSPNVDVDDREKMKVPFENIVPIMPWYFPDIDAETIYKMVTGALPGPAISIGAGLASVLAANESVNIILNKRKIVTAPEYTYIDLIDQKFEVRSIS